MHSLNKKYGINVANTPPLDKNFFIVENKEIIKDSNSLDFSIQTDQQSVQHTQGYPFTRLLSGDISLNLTDFHIPSFLKSIRESYVSQCREKGHNFSLNIDDIPFKRMKQDEKRLRQILDYYIQKVLNCADPQIIDITATGEKEGLLRISLTVSGTYALIEEPSRDTEKEIYYRQIIELMEGCITKNRFPGQAAIIELTFPDRLEENNKQPESMENTQGILIGGDPTNKREIHDLLRKRKNCSIVHAEKGQDIIKALYNTQIDLIIMDSQLSGLKVNETIFLIRKGMAGVGNKNIPIILLTKKTQPDVKAHSIHLILSDPAKLESAVSKFLPVSNPPFINKKDFLNRSNGEMDLLPEICLFFAESVESRMEELQKYINGNDMKSLAKGLHTLKGMYSQISAISLMKSAEKIESLVKENNPKTQSINKKWSELKRMHTLLLNEIDEINGSLL